jgi:hypothetical protein
MCKLCTIAARYQRADGNSQVFLLSPSAILLMDNSQSSRGSRWPAIDAKQHNKTEQSHEVQL